MKPGSLPANDRELLLAFLDVLQIRYDDPRPPEENLAEWTKKQLKRYAREIPLEELMYE